MSTRIGRERDFWAHHVPSVDVAAGEFEAGPDPNTARALELLRPLEGQSVLDVGCGAGVFTAWLASMGAHVTGIDASPALIERAAELHKRLGLRTQFVDEPLPSTRLAGHTFDRLAGRYVLHHLELTTAAAELAALLRPAGTAAFIETLALNPALSLARAHLVGRLGIPRFGSEDERPLGREDLRILRDAFGELHLETAQMQFLRILDRQVLRYRYRFASHALARVDDLMLGLGLPRLSYHQVLLLSKPSVNGAVLPPAPTVAS